MPRRAINGQKTTEAGFLRKRRRATAVAAAQAPGADAHRAECSENGDDFDDEKQQKLRKQHAALGQPTIQAYVDGKVLRDDDEESWDVVKSAADASLKRRLARAAEARRAKRMSARRADLGPHLREAVCWVDRGVMSDELSRALRTRGCRSTENRADAAIYIVSDPNKPGRRVLWYASLKGAFVVTGRAFTHPADVRDLVVKYHPATSPARTVCITEAFAAKHTDIATILRDTCRSWTFEVDFEAPGLPSGPPVAVQNRRRRNLPTPPHAAPSSAAARSRRHSWRSTTT